MQRVRDNANVILFSTSVSLASLGEYFCTGHNAHLPFRNENYTKEETVYTSEEMFLIPDGDFWFLEFRKKNLAQIFFKGRGL